MGSTPLARKPRIIQTPELNQVCYIDPLPGDCILAPHCAGYPGTLTQPYRPGPNGY
jgi:hypothetical protein